MPLRLLPGQGCVSSGYPRIAETIASSTDLCKVIMLAGPSSSGKTTTAHILLDALRECGIGSQVISLDNFYKGESDAPLLENGQHDYESVEALNVPLLERCLLDLMETNTCDMPVFDFENHCPHPYTRVSALGNGRSRWSRASMRSIQRSAGICRRTVF